MDQGSDEEKVCDICGHTGVIDAMLYCSQCEVNHEHMYCARVLLEEFVDGWICGECEFSNKPMPEASPLLRQGSKSKPVEVGKCHELPAESKKLHNESRVGSGNWEKRVETGKTKYLPVNEAIMLSSGEMSCVNFRWCPKPKQPTRSAIRRKTVPMNFSSHQDPASGSSKQPKLQRLGKAICEKQLQRPTKLAVPVSSLQPSEAPRNRDMQKELPRDIQWAQTKARRVLKKQSCTPNLGPITITGVDSLTTNEQKINDANVLPLEKCSWAPALDVLWKGSFNIQEDKLNPQIQAHPPFRVHRKVYEFSMKMPDVLHFQLVSAKTCWLNVFNELTPDEKDIALYFFPSVEGRWAEYISLVESISMRDLALKEQIDDIELFVFTSKRLPLNFQCVDENYYLWGVFHRPKHATTKSRAQELPILPSHDDDTIHAHDQVDDGEEVDMEVDMIGGVDVGRLDIPVKKESNREASTNVTVSMEPSLHDLLLPVKRDSNGETSTRVTICMEPSIHHLIPPGFEEVYKSRILGLASLRKNI
ncbi:hypothetical protein ACS0TY_035425 [Phlomoides rotata]